VLELTEHTRVRDYQVLRLCLDRFRERGVRIAVDDAGAGYAGLQHILSLSPDVIKLDLQLTRNVDSDPARRALSACLVQFAREIGAEVVAEGIETPAELDTLRTLGIRWGQGFYLGRPAPVAASGATAVVVR
jgi:EAL domain-containing protein (putative c-di-GMP-specific phosphodiesterase class I)